MSGFPKTLHHPHGRAAQIQDLGRNTYHGTAALLPPIEVFSAEQEAQYRALGYLEYGESPRPMIQYHEYPKQMVHPDHVDAAPERKEPRKEGEQIVFDVIAGRPERFPAVTVNGREEEQAWEAKGYHVPGRSDPQAAEAQMVAPGAIDHKPQEWPKLVDGKVVDPDAGPKGPIQYPKALWKPDRSEQVIVQSAAEELDLLRQWHGAPPGPVPAPPEPDQVEPPPGLTRGQKAAETRRRNAEARAAAAPADAGDELEPEIAA